MTTRQATVERRTGETQIALELAVDGEGRAQIDTGLPFFDHMLTLFARHSLVNLTVRATGDLQVDSHHTVEDVGITLGQAFARALHATAVSICRWTRRWREWSLISAGVRFWNTACLPASARRRD